MILFSQMLQDAIEEYNEQTNEEKHLDYWEVIDTIEDVTNPKEMLECINEIYVNIK